MPTVSIIVPNYNHSKFLPERLESIFNQTYQDYEVILLDDHSNDNSAQLLSTYSSHPKVSQIVVNDENSGSPFKQWKRGVSLAAGIFVWLAESDDVADPSFLEVLVPVLMNSPTVGVGYCQSQVIDDKSQIVYSNVRWTDDLQSEIWRSTFQLKGTKAVRDFFMYKNVIPNASAVLFRKEVFNTITIPIETFKFVGDWMTWVQMLLRSDLYFTPLHLNHFRQHPATTRVRKTSARRIQYFIEVYKVINSMDLTFEKLEEARHNIAKNLYRKLGIRYLFTWKGFLISKKISSFDPHFKKRVLKLFLGNIKKKLK